MRGDFNSSLIGLRPDGFAALESLGFPRRLFFSAVERIPFARDVLPTPTRCSGWDCAIRQDFWRASHGPPPVGVDEEASARKASWSRSRLSPHVFRFAWPPLPRVSAARQSHRFLPNPNTVIMGL